jgi:8-amino-7-oxononanoate synthase
MSAWDLAPALARQQNRDLYRQRRLVGSAQGVKIKVDGRECLCFCSNDYLALAAHPKLKQALREGCNRYGVGASASHLINGHMQPHHDLEQQLADFTGRSRALLFSTGYMANLGVMGALLGKSDAVFSDKLNHASLIDAIKLCGAKSVRYAHQNIAHLRSRLHSVQAQRKLIATDGVFSMEGDLAQLPELARLATQQDAWLMVDDAHGLGVLGERGAGTLEAQGVNSEQVPILMGTLGKALGTFGAFVAGSEQLIETLIQFSRTYIYTTALPPAVAFATLTSLDILKTEPERREHLRMLIQRFRAGAAQLDLPLLSSETAVQPMLVGDAQSAVDLNQFLWQRDFWVSAIRPPTVPEGTARLRITLSAGHTEQQLEQLLDALAQAKAQLPRIFHRATN